MRVLMHVRPDWRELPGGDLVQLQRWTVWLRRLGHEVIVSDQAEPDLRNIDLVHFHNLARAYALWPALEHCRRVGVPRVLTPLYWPTEEFDRIGRPGFASKIAHWLPGDWRGRLKSAARSIRAPGQRRALLREVWLGPRTVTRRFLAGFDALIANSKAEAVELGRLQDPLPPTYLAPSGVDAFFWSSDPRMWAEERQPILQAGKHVPAAEELGSAEQYTDVAPKVGVLCVARFDPQKAQHRLIEALRPLEVQLTLAGPDNPNYPAYRRYCRQVAGSGVTILSRRSSMELRKLYTSCKVFALCSWYEISALSGLEAACSGARVVITSRGGWHEYGGDLAWYADPADLGSIRRAVEAALQAPATPPLRERVLANFTWEHSARALLEAYARTLAAPRQAA